MSAKAVTSDPLPGQSASGSSTIGDTCKSDMADEVELGMCGAPRMWWSGSCFAAGRTSCTSLTLMSL